MILFLLSLSLQATPEGATVDQKPSAEVQKTTVVRRTLELPDVFQGAFRPYTGCIASKLNELDDGGVAISSDPAAIEQIKLRCRTAQEDAVFYSATILERETSLSLDVRKQMISEGFGTINQFFFDPPQPPTQSRIERSER